MIIMPFITSLSGRERFHGAHGPGRLKAYTAIMLFKLLSSVQTDIICRTVLSSLRWK